MKKLPRILTVLSSLLLGAMFFLPIWYIRLEAPQYPEGISLYIKLSTIVGGGEFDLMKVNMLNHYIGMKAIDAASIPELRFMPWIVGLLVVSGLLVAWSGKFKALIAWSASFAAVALAGLVDFYRWGYDYGHNLAPDAVIKVPGMTYQPPLIGSKQLLNFNAQSWPAPGGIAAGLALLLAFVAIVLTLKGRRSVATVAALGVLATACAPRTSVPEFSFNGKESCGYCKMAITDSRVGGVVRTEKGKEYQFDSVDCLASFVSGNQSTGSKVWVVNFDRPGTLLPVDEAAFIPRPAGLFTGMAGTLVAVSARRSESETLSRPNARSWAQVLASNSDRSHQQGEP